jgi:hypothetical protein
MTDEVVTPIVQLTLSQRVNEVRRQVQYVKKDKTVDNRYKVVSHDNVVALLHDLVVEIGILIYPNQISGKLNEPIKVLDSNGNEKLSPRMYEGGYTIRFQSVDDKNDYIDVTIEAHALDTGDKAPGKAVTYATKSAMLKMFFLETGEDEESRVEGKRPITKTQSDIIIRKLGHDKDRMDKFCAAYGIEAIEDLPKEEFNKATAAIDKSNQTKGEKS